jgi:hypothetical protein
VATAVALTLVLAGTLWGQDDHFPFGPFRMYATTTKGAVKTVELEGTTSTGRRVELKPDQLGLRRSEVEGRLRAFVADPGRLSRLFAEHDRQDDGPRLVEIRLVQRIQLLRDGHLAGSRQRVLAVGTRP